MTDSANRPEGDIARRARIRWREELPARDNVDNLTWLAIKKVLWPMLKEMSDEIEAQRAEIEELRSGRRRGRDD